MNAGVSFQPGVQGTTQETTQGALQPLQTAVKLLSFNLPVAAAQKFSPLASAGATARGFNPETLVAQTLLKTLAGPGQPNQTLLDHLTSLLAGMSDRNAVPGQGGAPTPSTVSPGSLLGSLTPTITPGSTQAPVLAPSAQITPPAPPVSGPRVAPVPVGAVAPGGTRGA